MVLILLHHPVAGGAWLAIRLGFTPIETAEFLARGEVPQRGRLVPARRHELTAVGRVASERNDVAMPQLRRTHPGKDPAGQTLAGDRGRIRPLFGELLHGLNGRTG